MRSLNRCQSLWKIWSEFWVWISYPSGLTEFTTFGQCRQWSRKNRQRTDKKKKLSDSCEFIVLQTPSVKVHKKGKKRTKPIFSHHGQTRIYILSHTFAFSADENVLGRWIFTAWYKVTVTYTESYKLELTAFCSEQREKKEAVKYLLSGLTGKRPR